jgi:hypothetical protein
MPIVKRLPQLDPWGPGEANEGSKGHDQTPLFGPRENSRPPHVPAGEASGPNNELAAALPELFGLWGDDEQETQPGSAVELRVGPTAALNDGEGGGGAEAATVAACEGAESVPAQICTNPLIAEAITTGPNAERAQEACAALVELCANNPDAASRLTPEIVAMLINGVADPRSDSARGQAGVLGVEQVTEAAQALLGMPEESYQQLSETLNQAGLDDEGQAVEGADAGAEQALLLETLASRRDLLTGNPEEVDAAMAEITQFGDTIRGVERDTLMARTTLIDVHDGEGDAAGNDDALRQTYTRSCAPSVAIMARAEMDPIFAWKVQTGQIDAAQLQLDYMTSDGERAVRREPTEEGVVYDNSQTGDDGTFIKGAYSEIGATEAANIDDPVDTRGAVNIMSVDPGYIEVMDDALRDGQPVPLQTSAFGGHFMLATDVRGEGAEAKYLVTDPWTGKTEWVSQEDLTAGRFGETFGDAEVDGSFDYGYVEPYITPTQEQG